MFEPWTTTFSLLILVLGPDRCWSSEAERRLLDDLLANYQKFERPVAIESDPVNLKISISLQQVRQFPGLGSTIRVESAKLGHLLCGLKLSHQIYVQQHSIVPLFTTIKLSFQSISLLVEFCSIFEILKHNKCCESTSPSELV